MLNFTTMVTGYINAGGRGTRLNGLFTPDPEKGIAKALIEVGTPPIKLIDHHVGKLSTLDNVVVGAGDQPLVAEYAARIGADCHTTPFQYGTGGELLDMLRARDLKGTVVVANCDTIIDIDIEAFALTHRVKGAGMTIALTKNKGVPNEDAFCLDEDSKIVYSAESNVGTPGGIRRASSTGVVAVETEYLRSIDWTPTEGEYSLYRDILGESIRRGEAYAYDNGFNFFQDLGTVAAFLEFSQSTRVQELLIYKEKVNGMV